MPFSPSLDVRGRSLLPNLRRLMINDNGNGTYKWRDETHVAGSEHGIVLLSFFVVVMIGPPPACNWYMFMYNVPTRPVFTSSRLPNIPLFELSRSQTNQLMCVFISPKMQLAGYLAILRWWGRAYSYTSKSQWIVETNKIENAQSAFKNIEGEKNKHTLRLHGLWDLCMPFYMAK